MSKLSFWNLKGRLNVKIGVLEECWPSSLVCACAWKNKRRKWNEIEKERKGPIFAKEKIFGKFFWFEFPFYYIIFGTFY